MNREQRTYIIKAIDSILENRLHEIQLKWNEQLEKIKTPSQMMHDWIQKHKEQAGKELVNLALIELEKTSKSDGRGYVSKHANVTVMSDVNDNTLKQGAVILQEYKDAVNKVGSKYADMHNHERICAQALKDKAMLCDIPDEFAILLEKMRSGKLTQDDLV